MRKIICHGDSLTEGADIEPVYRWPALLQNALGGIEVINTGIGGDSTAGLLSNVQSLRQKLAAAAEESEIPVLDFFRLFMNDGGQVSPALFLEDGVHPNGRGHREMAVLAASKIKNIFFIQP